MKIFYYFLLGIFIITFLLIKILGKIHFFLYFIDIIRNFFWFWRFNLDLLFFSRETILSISWVSYEGETCLKFCDFLLEYIHWESVILLKKIFKDTFEQFIHAICVPLNTETIAIILGVLLSYLLILSKSHATKQDRHHLKKRWEELEICKRTENLQNTSLLTLARVLRRVEYWLNGDLLSLELQSRLLLLVWKILHDYNVPMKMLCEFWRVLFVGILPLPNSALALIHVP